MGKGGQQGMLQVSGQGEVRKNETLLLTFPSILSLSSSFHQILFNKQLSMCLLQVGRIAAPQFFLLAVSELKVDQRATQRGSTNDGSEKSISSLQSANSGHE